MGDRSCRSVTDSIVCKFGNGKKGGQNSTLSRTRVLVPPLPFAKRILIYRAKPKLFTNEHLHNHALKPSGMKFGNSTITVNCADASHCAPL